MRKLKNYIMGGFFNNTGTNTVRSTKDAVEKLVNSTDLDDATNALAMFSPGAGFRMKYANRSNKKEVIYIKLYNGNWDWISVDDDGIIYRKNTTKSETNSIILGVAIIAELRDIKAITPVIQVDDKILDI